MTHVRTADMEASLFFFFFSNETSQSATYMSNGFKVVSGLKLSLHSTKLTNANVIVI